MTLGDSSRCPDGVSQRLLAPALPIPLVLEPASGRASAAELARWAQQNRTWIDERLLAFGAILFRGFDVLSAPDFRSVVVGVGETVRDYVGGISPRSKIIDKVYESTRYPPQLPLPLHNEGADSTDWPARIMFGCLVAPSRAGETSLADGREFLARLDAGTRARFEQRGIRYSWIFADGTKGDGISKSWQEVLGHIAKPWQVAFDTDDRSVASEACRQRGFEFEWRSDGSLAMGATRAAMIRHPETMDLVWFNQVELRQSIQLRRLAPTTFGDGTKIAMEDIRNVQAASAKSEHTFPWHRGDVLLVDNVRCQHGRKPYDGEREIIVSLC